MTTAISTEVLEEGSLGLGPEDLQPPRLRFSGKEGHFSFMGDDSETFDEVLAVPLLKLRNTRIKWTADEASDDIECRSEDNIVPVNADDAAAIGAGPTCALCPFSKFSKDSTGKTSAPACTMFINLALASIPENESEEPAPFLFAVKSLSIKPLMNALNVIEQRRRKQRKPGYAYALQMRAGTQAGTGRRTYYPLTVSVAAESIPDELLPYYADLWRMMAALQHRLSLSSNDADFAPVFDENGNDLPQQSTDAPHVPISAAQLKAINAIVQKQQMAQDVLNSWLMEQFGCELKQLDSEQASRVIAELQATKV